MSDLLEERRIKRQESVRLQKERLEELKTILKSKQNTADDFKSRYNIDFDIALDENHPKFNDIYAFEDDKDENMVMAVKLKMGTRNTAIISSFFGYHIAKSVLWRMGYFAQFFYRTRLCSIPIWGCMLYYSIFKKFIHDLKDAQVYDYQSKRARLHKDHEMIRSLLSSHLATMKQSEKNAENEPTNILELINK